MITASPFVVCLGDAITFTISGVVNNGGLRIFPGKQSPNDASPDLRRQVDLVATVEPPISGVQVYFRVYDVDDPFNQLHGPNGGLLIVMGSYVVLLVVFGIHLRPTSDEQSSGLPWFPSELCGA